MKRIILSLVILTGLTSCATIISGSSQSITINSEPDRATVYDNGQRIGTTPFTASLKRKDNHTIRIELDGYEPKEIVLERKFNEWYIGNILFGGIIGLVVDPITGAIYKLSPNQVYTEFNKGTAFKQEKSDVYVAVTLTKNSEWESIGTLDKK